MPFVLRHAQTGEIAACVQRNNYNLDYFGVKQWSQSSEAEQEKEAFLDTLGFEDKDQWFVTSVTEDRVKVFNVKLKNDPSRRLIMDTAGLLSVQARD
ncbi:hypothetical protein [Paenibacillus cremeus]|uniref:Uncharacterized protein n=1 Tax=Paenibacillus cremeus TaxID=2163881 RepID=A0A559K536_9BACL|nr:hypothetical protein [Paenibacillus cremeus]TVY07252.1 hypothetical protein FPZ49_24785 [Paenibacillus cremeus]